MDRQKPLNHADTVPVPAAVAVVVQITFAGQSCHAVPLDYCHACGCEIGSLGRHNMEQSLKEAEVSDRKKTATEPSRTREREYHRCIILNRASQENVVRFPILQHEATSHCPCRRSSAAVRRKTPHESGTTTVPRESRARATPSRTVVGSAGGSPPVPAIIQCLLAEFQQDHASRRASEPAVLWHVDTQRAEQLAAHCAALWAVGQVPAAGVSRVP